MPRIYTVPAAPEAETAQIDIWEIAPGSNTFCQIIGIEVSQTTEVGDAEEEMLTLDIIRGYTTSGSAGNTITPAAVEEGMGAATFVAESHNTTVATTGSGVTVYSTAWNVRAGLTHYFPAGMEIGVTSRTVVRISAPADSVTYTGTLWVAEFG